MSHSHPHIGAASRRETVVLLHSSGGSSRQWNALATELAARYDVRTVDFHGHGGRAPWHGAGSFTLADDAILVEPLLQADVRVHLVGHSYGGAVALKVAARNPLSIASVSAYEPVLFRWLFDDDIASPAARESIAIAETVRKYLLRGDAYRAAEHFINYWSGTGTWEALSIERRDAQAGRMRSVLAHFDALAADPPSPFTLRRLAMPMLFLSGSATVASTRRIAALLRNALPRAQHVTIDGAGHLGAVTHAPQVNRTITHFLDAAVAGSAPRVALAAG